MLPGPTKTQKAARIRWFQSTVSDIALPGNGRRRPPCRHGHQEPESRAKERTQRVRAVAIGQDEHIFLGV